MFNYLKKRFGEHSTTFGIGLVAAALTNYAQGMSWQSVLTQSAIGVILSLTPTK